MVRGFYICEEDGRGVKGVGVSEAKVKGVQGKVGSLFLIPA